MPGEGAPLGRRMESLERREKQLNTLVDSDGFNHIILATIILSSILLAMVSGSWTVEQRQSSNDEAGFCCLQDSPANPAPPPTWIQALDILLLVIFTIEVRPGHSDTGRRGSQVILHGLRHC